MATPSRAAELKQQGALEAARDPNSSVTADQAEDKVVHEARSAGSAAYKFDPDATPEQKAAQANAVRLSLPAYSSSALLIFGRTANSLKLPPRAETQRRGPSFGYSESAASPTLSGARPKKLIKDAEHDRSQVRSSSAVEIGRPESPALSSLTNGKRPSAYA